jgi:hypothetical protein
MYWILIIIGLALVAGGAYVFKEGRDRSNHVIMREDGGDPAWLFRIFYKSYYFKFKNQKKYKAGFPDNYFRYLVSSGLATSLLGALLIGISLFNF